jgi:hypothetical protein
MAFAGPWNSRHQTHTGCAKKKVHPEYGYSSYFGACLVINLHPHHCKFFLNWPIYFYWKSKLWYCICFIYLPSYVWPEIRGGNTYVQYTSGIRFFNSLDYFTLSCFILLHRDVLNLRHNGEEEPLGPKFVRNPRW